MLSLSWNAIRACYPVYWILISQYISNFCVAHMRLPDEILKSVAFLGIEGPEGNFVPYGTALVARYPYKGRSFPFLVTAAHVVHQIRGETVSIRMNRTDGSAGIIMGPKRLAIIHKDPAVDIALLSMPASSDIYDFRYFDISREGLERSRNVWPYDIGDEISTVGLYTSHYGATKNLPVVRTGNIAMMPSEPVQTNAGYVRAYLVEARSLAGLSGSPVFANVPALTPSQKNQHAIEIRDQPLVSLIGIMLGYHVVSSAEDQIPAPDERPLLESRNTGLGVVAPIETVLDLLESDQATQRFNASIAAEIISRDYTTGSAVQET